MEKVRKILLVISLFVVGSLLMCAVSIVIDKYDNPDDRMKPISSQAYSIPN